MPEQVLRGRPASPGVGAGAARVLTAPVASAAALPVEAREGAALEAEEALRTAARELDSIAADLRAAGRDDEAEIVETGSLMAGDPSLAAGVRERVIETGATAASALVAATGEHAEALAAIADETLAARADDIASLGRRAARIVLGESGSASTGVPLVLVAEDLGPADVAELDEDVVAIALAAGGVTAHAAIVARSLGLPMVVNAGGDLMTARDGEPLVVDGDAGEIVLAPGAERLEEAEAARARRASARAAAEQERTLPATTADGRGLTVLVNAAGAAEARAGLDAGAAGIGLLRTELAFLDALAWPSVADHERALRPVLNEVGAATVRVLDFGGDKTPPFLRGESERGIALLMKHPEALAAQLEAIDRAGEGTELRVMLPMVASAAEVETVRSLLPGVQAGAMIETWQAVAAIDEIASASDFLSIGTNDLTHSVLGSDRFAPGEVAAHHPRVLDAIARTVEAARAADIPVEVCGEAASDPITVPLLVGLGVDELSVGASRVGAVRRWVRALDYLDVRRVASAALGLTDAVEVARLVDPIARRLVLLEAGEAGGERVNGGGRVATLGRQA
ncbi:MAG: multiphosphoryl transfer protein [Thermoleophilaceae bacterium]|nr:multiphosphoryl transfer protein [Thermoleophilaceae bacterium]